MGLPTPHQASPDGIGLASDVLLMRDPQFGFEYSADDDQSLVRFALNILFAHLQMDLKE
jgi:hypothetical protein